MITSSNIYLEVYLQLGERSCDWSRCIEMHGQQRLFLLCTGWMDLLYHMYVTIVLVVYKRTGPWRHYLLDGHLHIKLPFHDRGLHVQYCGWVRGTMMLFSHLASWTFDMGTSRCSIMLNWDYWLFRFSDLMFYLMQEVLYPTLSCMGQSVVPKNKFLLLSAPSGSQDARLNSKRVIYNDCQNVVH
jgi:hypothetical protein